jgi:hypothetical protein
MHSTKISGFTVIRNGILMGYPVLQSIKSILPMVDEFIVGVGQSEDRTKDQILSLQDPKIRIFDSHWDTAKTKGGLILSEKTNEALDRCRNDWCFYLQADEVVHENDLDSIARAVETYQEDKRVNGLLFKYTHFYGSYETIATSRRWYRNEIRLVRRSSGIRSYNDAQGFRVAGEKPTVVSSGGRIFHYGWVKPPRLMAEKSKLLNRWWHGNKRDHEFENFKYDRQYGLKQFEGTHPLTMRELVDSQDWKFEYQRRWLDWTLKDLNLLGSDLVEKLFNYRIGEYRPYRLIKNS